MNHIEIIKIIITRVPVHKTLVSYWSIFFSSYGKVLLTSVFRATETLSKVRVSSYRAQVNCMVTICLIAVILIEGGGGGWGGVSLPCHGEVHIYSSQHSPARSREMKAPSSDEGATLLGDLCPTPLGELPLIKGSFVCQFEVKKAEQRKNSVTQSLSYA